MIIKEFLSLMNEDTNKIYEKDDLTPVIITNQPSGGAGAKGPKVKFKGDVDIINVNSESNDSDSDNDNEEENKEDKKNQNKSQGSGKKKGNIDPSDEKSKGSGLEGAEKSEDDGEKGKYTEKRELPKTLDSHEILSKSDETDMREMAKKIYERSYEKRKEKAEREEEVQKSTGEGGAGGFQDTIRKIHKPRVDWVKALANKLNEFKSRTAKTYSKYSEKEAKKYKMGVGRKKAKSYTTYLKNPRSHSQTMKGADLLARGPYVKAPAIEIMLIIAIDASGSIGKSTLEKIMSEVDSIANAFKRGIKIHGIKLNGKVYLMTWDSIVYTNSLGEYKAGDWKKYVKGERKIEGGGGNDIAEIYHYLNSNLAETGNGYYFNFLNKPNPNRPNPHDQWLPADQDGKCLVAPFLLIPCDGQFAPATEKDLGLLYTKNHKNILHLVIDGVEEGCYPKNIIEYNSLKI